MPLFVRVTLAVTAGLLALVVLAFLIKLIVIAAVVAAVVVGSLFLTRRFRRRRLTGRAYPIPRYEGA